jgi:hypothetical protein
MPSQIVLLGNSNPQMRQWVAVSDENGESRQVQVSIPARHLRQSVTRVEFPEGFDDPAMVARALTLTPTSGQNDRLLVQRASVLGEPHKRYAIALHHIEEILGVHSGGVGPSYVAVGDYDADGNWIAGDPELQAAIANYFGCVQGEPTGLVTNAGRDAHHAQMFSTSTQPAAMNYMAISTSTGSAFAATDTTLASEITTNGLARAQATYAHTAGTNTTTLTHTWTYSSTGSVVIASMGTFNASSSGTLGEEDALSSSVTVSNSGDTCTVTFTFTA